MSSDLGQQFRDAWNQSIVDLYANLGPENGNTKERKSVDAVYRERGGLDGRTGQVLEDARRFAGSGREQHGKIFSGASAERKESDSLPSASPSVEDTKRRNTGRNDDQSHQRTDIRQPDIESRDCNDVGQSSTRNANRADRSVRGKESSLQVDMGASRGDSADETQRNEAEGDRRTDGGGRQAGKQDMQRSSMVEKAGIYSASSHEEFAGDQFADQYARRLKSSPGQLTFDDDSSGKWIQIGGERGPDGHRHGGHPVKVDSQGKMLSGHFAGKTLGEAFGGSGQAHNRFEKPQQKQLDFSEPAPEKPRHESLLEQAEMYRHPGENYNRNIAVPANRLHEAIAKGYKPDSGHVGILSDELEMRLKHHGNPDENDNREAQKHLQEMLQSGKSLVQYAGEKNLSPRQRKALFNAFDSHNEAKRQEQQQPSPARAAAMQKFLDRQKQSGITLDTRANESAKPGDQMGLFGDVTNVPKPKATLDKAGETKGQQMAMFDTKGDPDQMLMFDDGVTPEDRLMPEAKKPFEPTLLGKPSALDGMQDDPIWMKDKVRGERGQLAEISGLQASKMSGRELDNFNRERDDRMGNAHDPSKLSGYSQQVIAAHKNGEVDENTPGIHPTASDSEQYSKRLKLIIVDRYSEDPLSLPDESIRDLYHQIEHYWNEAQHPRNPSGSPVGGQFRSTKVRDLPHLAMNAPRISASHQFHHSKLPPELQQAALEWSAKLHELVGNPMNTKYHESVMAQSGKPMTPEQIQEEKERRWKQVDKKQVRELLEKMNNMDKTARAHGIDLAAHVNASKLIPQDLAERLSGGSRFFDPSKLPPVQAEESSDQQPTGDKPRTWKDNPEVMKAFMARKGILPSSGQRIQEPEMAGMPKSAMMPKAIPGTVVKNTNRPNHIINQNLADHINGEKKAVYPSLLDQPANTQPAPLPAAAPSQPIKPTGDKPKTWKDNPEVMKAFMARKGILPSSGQRIQEPEMAGMPKSAMMPKAIPGTVVKNTNRPNHIINQNLADHINGEKKAVYPSLLDQPANTQSAPLPAAAPSQPIKPTRNYTAGMNRATVQFESPLHQRLYDIGSNLRPETGRNPRRGMADMQGAIENAANQLGISHDEVKAYARDVYDHTKEQMKGVQDGEARAVKLMERAPYKSPQDLRKDHALSAQAAGQVDRVAADTIGDGDQAKIEHFKGLIMDAWKQARDEAQEHNTALRTLQGLMGGGTFAAQLSQHLARGNDVATVKGFDEAVDHARRNFPHLVGGADDAESGVVDMMREGIREVPQPWHDEVVDRAVQMAPPGFFDEYVPSAAQSTADDDETVPFSVVEDCRRFVQCYWLHGLKDYYAGKSQMGLFEDIDATKVDSSRSRGSGWRPGLDNGNGRWRIHGISRDVTTCQRCFRSGLERTIIVELMDDNGNGTGEKFYLGSECASKVTGSDSQKITRDAIDKSYREEMARRKAQKELYTFQDLVDLYAGKTQMAFDWDESAHPRESVAHDGKKPGEFAPKASQPKPKRELPEGYVEQPRAKAGGEVSDVDGKFYKGGALMPVHGLFSGQEKLPPKAKKLEGSSPLVKENEEGKGVKAVRERSKEEVAADRERMELQQKWDLLRSGPIGEMFWTGDRPGKFGYDVKKKLLPFLQSLPNKTISTLGEWAKRKIVDHELATNKPPESMSEAEARALIESDFDGQVDYTSRIFVSKKLASEKPGIGKAIEGMRGLTELPESISVLSELESVIEQANQESSPKPEATAKTAGDAVKQGASRKRSNIGVFVKPIVGPSGASLVAYDWKWQWEPTEDGEGERKVSDWSRSETNEHTGREIVHQFHVQTPDGMKVVSVDSAIRILGLSGEAGNRVRNLGTALAKLAMAKQKLDKLKSEKASEWTIQNATADVDRAEKHAKLLEQEAAKRSAGKNPADEYRDLLRKAHELVDKMKTAPNGEKQASSWGAVPEIVKALEKQGRHNWESIESIKKEGVRIFGTLLKSSGLDMTGGRQPKGPHADDYTFRNWAKAKDETVKASSDMQMRNWFAKHGDKVKQAIEDAEAWLQKHTGETKDKYAIRHHPMHAAAPTEAQKEAGNYRMSHIKLHGLEITIETPKGRKRNPEWPTMKAHYGYIKRTLGSDGDHVDVFVGPDRESTKVWVVDQVKPSGQFDEHKVMLGFRSREAAIAAYRGSYSIGWRVGPVTEMSIEKFKRWLASGKTDKAIA